MKKWVKRSIGAALLAVTAVGLTACGSKSASNSDVPTLLMYQIGDKPKNYDTLIAKTNKILEKKAKAKIKIQYIGWGDYTQKMSVIVSSGEKYDIAKADNYAVNAQKGAYTDLTKLLPKYAPTAYKDLDPAYIKGNKVDGKLYTMPINGNVYAQQVVSFNKKYLDKYNIDVSKINSYKDLEDTFAKFHSADKKVLTFSTGPTFHIGSDLDFVIDQDYPFAVDAVNKGKKIINPYNDAKYKETLRTMHDYYQKGYIAKDAATDNTDRPLSGDTWFARQETQGPFDYGDHQLSQTAGQQIVSRPMSPAVKTTAQAGMYNYVVSNNSKNKVKAVKVLGVINSDPELLNGLVYGEKGKAWKYVDNDKRVKLLKGYKENYHSAPWQTGDNNKITLTTDVTDQMIQERKDNIDKSIDSPILGFQFNTKNVKTEMTNISNVMNKYMAGLQTGTSDPDTTIPKMNKELKKAGYDKVQKEMQKQYDEFLKDGKN